MVRSLDSTVFILLLRRWRDALRVLAEALRAWVSAILPLAARTQEPVSDENAAAQPMDRAASALDRWGNAILRLAYSCLRNKEDAEDVLRDTLLQYLRKAPVFESEEHEKAWLLRVASNLARNKLKYNRYRAADELDEELVAREREDLSFVWDAVKALPERYREVIHLFYQEDLPTARIADILRERESTIRSRLHRARGLLRESLGEAYDFGV